MNLLLIAVAALILVVVVLNAFKDSGKQKCPACRQMIPKGVDQCPNCQTFLKARPQNKI
jgi:hypothetical protein